MTLPAAGPAPGARSFALLLAAALGLAGCQGGTPSSAAVPTPSRPAGARVALPSGAIYRVELARTAEEMAQGLMFRESLADRTGMLFLFPRDDESHQFWMKNTLIPLDIIWLDAQGKVLYISANTPPCKADPCPNYGPDFAIASVLEIAGGMAEKEKVTVGSTLRLMDIPR
ncbi:MAG TPA: DUF192 domain-containing protein [Thermoanaerobaculia bacterium]|nr:DUF192 domain-containing protein [Thermoanaerobaculia bacterium]